MNMLRHHPMRFTALLVVTGTIAAAGLIVLTNGGGKESAPRAALTVYPTPAPMTFIPPTPLPPTITPTDPVVAHQVPDVTFATLDGETVQLRDLGGEVVFLNFWATWCEPCTEEMPALQAFQAQYGADGVRVIGVTDPTSGQTEDDIRAFVAEYGITFTIALSSDQALYSQFGVAQIPTTFIIDPTGLVRIRHLGAVDSEDMVGYMRQFISDASN